jgi:transcriptional regulator with GAF, ATPase, and Fis domain
MNRMPSDRIGSEIAAAMHQLESILGMDRILFSELSPDGNTLTAINAFSAPHLPDLPPSLMAISLPAVLEKITQGGMLLLPSFPDDLAAGDAAERSFAQSTGIRSAVMIPVKSGSKISHVLSAFRLQKTEWTGDVIACLQQTAELFSSAYTRMASEELTPLEELLNEISSAYINLPPREIEHVVNHDLGRLTRLIGADRYAICLAEDIKTDSLEFTFSFDYWPNELRDQIEADQAWLMAHGGHHLFKYITARCLKGHPVIFSSVDELPENESELRITLQRLGIKSQLAVPISANRETIGFMLVHTTRMHRIWSEDLTRKVRQFGDLFANAYVRKRFEEARRVADSEIQRLKSRLESDYRYLSDEFTKNVGGKVISGTSPAMNRVMEQVMQVAPTQTPVLLLGETGVGKGMLAMALHRASRRASRPLVQLNCATLAPGLIESELFGHERGAFTGADRQRAGRFEIAEGTTLFLDEIGELPPELQGKLLRVLETGEFERLGGSRSLKTDARIIAATNRDLEAEVAAGRFRKDLWYRLSIFPIRIPPLRERTEDIPAIVKGFVAQFSKHSGKRFSPIPQDIMNALKQYPWPGNVRELKNLIERAVIVSPDTELCLTLPKQPDEFECRVDLKQIMPFTEMERAYLLRTLAQTGGRIEGAGGAADLLALNPSTLRSRMRKLDIKRTAVGQGNPPSTNMAPTIKEKATS